MRLRFDRGTLLLDEPPPRVDPALLPGVRHDPRVDRWRAPASAARGIGESLGRLGAPFEDGTLAPCARAQLVLGTRHVPLRWYQQAALDAWDDGGRRGVVALPTGSGKTRVAMAAIARLGVPALVVVPTRVLMRQWSAALARWLDVPVGRLGDGECSDRPLTVATYASAWRRMERLGGRFGLVVVDEAHHVGEGRFEECLEMCAAPWRLGLSATPREGDAARVCDDLVGPVVFRLAAGDLAGSDLAPFDLVRLTLELSADEAATHRAHMAAFDEVYRPWRKLHPAGEWRDFVTAVSHGPEGRRAVASWRMARRTLAYPIAKARALERLLSRHAGERTLIFTYDNDSAYAIARSLLIMPITCSIRRAERAWALDAFRSGALRALVSAKVLNEGFDLPEAAVGIIVGGGQGTREYVQRVGRLMRAAPGKRARLYELVTYGTVESWRASGRMDAIRGTEGPAAPVRRPSNGAASPGRVGLTDAA